jgi:hypothetical protein
MRHKEGRHIRLAWTALVLCPFGQAAAMDEQPVDGVAAVLITVDARDNPTDIGRRIEQIVDDGGRVAVAGAPAVLARMRPAFAEVWPETNTVVLDAGVTLGISGFDAGSDSERVEKLKGWAWDDALWTRPPMRYPRGAEALPEVRQQVDFQVLASSPAEVCRNFSAKLAASLKQMTSPTAAVRKAFRREVRRWCQYGTLSEHLAERPQFTIEPYGRTDDIRLTLAAEWALIRNEDAADKENTSYIFWVKTMGEGAGTGFTRVHGRDGWYDADAKVMHGLLDAAIHSGWGPIEDREVVTAWPLTSFPEVGNVHVFRCDAPNDFRPYECPLAALPTKIYPDDSHDGAVTVSSSETVSFSGDLAAARSKGRSDSATHVTAGLSIGRMFSATSQVASSLTDVRTNGDTISYRSTWWHPDIAGLQHWIDARRHGGRLVKATALASTLNPRHEIVWKLRLEGNRQRDLPYHVVYEAGLNTCINGNYCKDYRVNPHPELPVKARMGWSDGIVIRLPSN